MDATEDKDARIYPCAESYVKAIEYLSEAQDRVLARLGPYVGDTGSAHTCGVRKLLEPTERIMFNQMVREEAEKIWLVLINR
jgi:hypothetical protein